MRYSREALRRAADKERGVPWTLAGGRLHGLAPGTALVLRAAFLLAQMPVHERLEALEQAPTEALVLARCHRQQKLTLLVQVPAHAEVLGRAHGQMAQEPAMWPAPASA